MPHFVIRCMAPIRNAWLFLRKPRHRRFAKQASSVRTKIHAFEHAGQKMNYLKKVNPYVFEEMVVRAIAASMHATPWYSAQYSGDGGFDGRVHHPVYGWMGIQSKRYKEHIRIEHIKQFMAACTQKGYRVGWFVHCGKTSAHFPKMWRQGNTVVRVISGDLLLKILGHDKLPEEWLRKVCTPTG